MSDPFAVTIATIPIFAVIFYLVMYGFDHWWFTAGIVIWRIASSITKNYQPARLCVDQRPKNTDPEESRKKRYSLQEDCPEAIG
jgi:hypothetical protein